MEKPDCVCPVCSEVFTGEEGTTAYLPVGVDLLEQSLHWVCEPCGAQVAVENRENMVWKF